MIHDAAVLEAVRLGQVELLPIEHLVLHVLALLVPGQLQQLVRLHRVVRLLQVQVVLARRVGEVEQRLRAVGGGGLALGAIKERLELFLPKVAPAQIHLRVLLL